MKNRSEEMIEKDEWTAGSANFGSSAVTIYSLNNVRCNVILNQAVRYSKFKITCQLFRLLQSVISIFRAGKKNKSTSLYQ